MARGSEKELLDAEDVAGILGVGATTVWRWCREGSLPCIKVGKSWRIRREALAEFLERGEQPATLVGQMRSFIEVPDNVLAIARNREFLHRLDAAFLRVGDARGGTLVKYLGGEPETSTDELRTDLERNGLDVARLEEEGRLRFVEDPAPPGGRADELRRLLAELADSDHTIWASFNWTAQIDLDAALEQQEALGEAAGEGHLVVKTAVLEEIHDEWPPKIRRRAQVSHSGTIWLSENGLVLSRLTPPPVL